jgi:two-component system sensor histidine kinase YesM
MSIHQKIFSYIFSMIVILFVAVSIAVYLLFYRSFFENEVRNIINNQDNVTENVRFMLEQIEGAATMIAANTSIAAEVGSAATDYQAFDMTDQLHHIATLENTANILEVINGIHIVTSKGEFFSSNTALDTTHASRLRDLYSSQVLNPGETYTGLQALTLSTGYTFSAISYVRPIYNYHSEYSLAVLIIDIDYVKLREVLTAAAIKNHEWVLLVDRSGNTIFTYPYNTILDPILIENPDLLRSNQTLIEQKVFGREMIVSSSDIATPSWSMVRLIPLVDIRQELNSIEVNLVLIILLYILIALFSSYYISKIFIRPIKEMYEKFRAVECGDLSVRIQNNRKDEFGHLSHSFNAMVGQIDLLLKQQLHEQKQKSDLEFEILQAQINPHFLYNTLDSIRWLAVIQNANNIGELTNALINLLKYNISVKKVIVLLEDEIRSLGNYIVVQKYRYGDTFEAIFDLDPQTLQCEVLHFMLQPIAENAIIHGFEEISHAGLIKISSQKDGNDLLISVSDNGIGIEPDKIADLENNPADMFNGIGMSNIHNRIQLHYGKTYGLTIASQIGSGTTVTIRLPYQLGIQKRGTHDQSLNRR